MTTHEEDVNLEPTDGRGPLARPVDCDYPGGHSATLYPRWVGSEPQEVDPDLDDLTAAQLAELSGPAATVAGVLGDWLWLTRKIAPSGHHSVGTFLELLAAEGYRVTKIEAPAATDLLPEVSP
jgi:hypothetical protein